MRLAFSTIGSAVFGGVLLGFAVLAENVNLPEQIIASSIPFQPGAATHETRAGSQTAPQYPNASEVSAEIEAVSSAPRTRSSFMATWDRVTGATGYLLDVSTSDSFSDYVGGYHDSDVGNVTGRVVTGLGPGSTYYYRVRPYTSTGPGGYSEVTTAKTVPTTGLIINATFDSSITADPNAAAIEAMINRAISICESLFSDPMTIEIRFRYATTTPNGNPLPMGTISRSDFVFYPTPWSTFINALRADAKTSNDNLANASLPGSALSVNIKPTSANGRAVGLNTPPAMFANGTVGNGGPYDGIVTLNSADPFQFTRPTNSGSFDAQRSTEHEIDEVIGLGSHLNLNPPGTDLRPQDLFSWSSSGVRNLTSSGTRYFSISGGSTTIVNFNQDPSGDFGDWLSTACPQAHPYVQNAFGCTGQSSDVASSSPEGINLDVIGYDLSRVALGNISTRGFVQTGNNVMIGGFIVEGTGPKTVILRAIGPELAAPPFNIPNALANPRLELHNGTGALIASNDNWQTTIIGGIITTSQVTAIQNSGHAPTQPSESAIIATLQPGNYTAIVSGVNNTIGVGLVEVYDISPNATSILGNISTRALVQTGDEVMIGGFIIQGAGSKRVIVRAIGPELSGPPFNIPNALANPTLELHNGTGALIASNDNWQTTIIGGIITASQVSAIQNSGHAPTQPSESAIIATLPPGNYTAIVRGVNNTIGVALVEVYDLQ
ncbi:MAG: fibronectin type III domain-containing protein [Candidatus Udaeobacter sp.]